MAGSHQIAIAKASLSASLLRADPAAISRDEITNFHTLLDKALTHCTPTNIQNCKRWILRNLASSSRLAALAKYLLALAPGLQDTTTSPTTTGKKTSARRKKLHVLYLINDLLHHTKFLVPDQGAFAEGVQGALEGLYRAAAAPGMPKQLAKLERLLGIWEGKEYYSFAFLVELRTAVKDTAVAKDGAAAKDVPGAVGEMELAQTKPKALLPPQHGDPSIPYYDLPAGNLLPLIVPNSTTPINPRMVKPVQFASITPDGKLVNTVQDFLMSVDSMFGGKETDGEPDAVGGVGGIDGEGYYGWSRAFCEQMRWKKKAAVEKDRGRGRDGSERDRGRRASYSSSYSSRSRSASRSRSRHTRRRGSRSVSNDSRRRARTRSQSPPRSNEAYRGFVPPDLAPPPPPPGILQPWSPLQQQQMLGFPPPPPPPPQQFPQGWVPPPPPPSHQNSTFQMPPQIQQYFAQMGAQGMQMQGMHAMQQMAYGQWQQQQQSQQSQQPQQFQQQQQFFNQQSASGYGMSQQQQQPPPPPPSNSEKPGFEDYRSIKGRQIGAKRGWKT